MVARREDKVFELSLGECPNRPFALPQPTVDRDAIARKAILRRCKRRLKRKLWRVLATRELVESIRRRWSRLLLKPLQQHPPDLAH